MSIQPAARVLRNQLAVISPTYINIRSCLLWREIIGHSRQTDRALCFGLSFPTLPTGILPIGLFYGTSSHICALPPRYQLWHWDLKMRFPHTSEWIGIGSLQRWWVEPRSGTGSCTGTAGSGHTVETFPLSRPEEIGSCLPSSRQDVLPCLGGYSFASCSSTDCPDSHQFRSRRWMCKALCSK